MDIIIDSPVLTRAVDLSLEQLQLWSVFPTNVVVDLNRVKCIECNWRGRQNWSWRGAVVNRRAACCDWNAMLLFHLLSTTATIAALTCDLGTAFLCIFPTFSPGIPTPHWTRQLHGFQNTRPFSRSQKEGENTYYVWQCGMISKHMTST